MKVYMRGRNNRYYANGEFDPKTGHLTVFKNSTINKDSLYSSEKFRLKKVAKLRGRYVKDNILTKDIEFSNPSFAANFVVGQSVNGWLRWNDEKKEKIDKYRNREK